MFFVAKIFYARSDANLLRFDWSNETHSESLAYNSLNSLNDLFFKVLVGLHGDKILF